MRRLLAIALPAVLLLCAPASAKEVTSATVCAADGCRSIEGAGEQLLQGGPPVDAPSQREPFVRLEFRCAAGRETGRVRNIFLPAAGCCSATTGGRGCGRRSSRRCDGTRQR